MPVTEIGDPRLQALFGASDPRDAGARPSVRLPRRGLPPIAIAIGVLLLGVLLFAVLNARRVSQVEPSVRAATPEAGATAWASPPPLYVPPAEAPITAPTAPVEQPTSRPQVVVAPVTTPAVRPAPQVIYAPQPAPQMSPPAPAPQQRVSAGAPLVIDTGGAAAGATAGTPGTYSSLLPSGQTNTRMRASALANRSMTVPQGTLIPAVLETGFCSRSRDLPERSFPGMCARLTAPTYSSRVAANSSVNIVPTLARVRSGR
jgi:Type IV secretory pathway, VirB10 components